MIRQVPRKCIQIDVRLMIAEVSTADYLKFILGI